MHRSKAFVILKLNSRHRYSSRKCQMHLNLTLEQLSNMCLDKSERKMIAFIKSKIRSCTALNYFSVCSGSA